MTRNSSEHSSELVRPAQASDFLTASACIMFVGIMLYNAMILHAADMLHGSHMCVLLSTYILVQH